MPSRLLREGILSSERVNALDFPAEVFYRRLMSKVDDHGLYDARPSMLRASLYPLKVDRVREADISRWIAACEKAGLIALYDEDGKPYLQMLDTRWQARSEPKFPLPPTARSGVQISTDANNCKQVKTAVHLVVVEDEDDKNNKIPNGILSASLDSEAPDIGEENQNQKKPALGEKPPSGDRIPYQAIVDAFNATMTELPKVRELTPKRRTLIRSAWQASPQRRSLGFFQAYLDECQEDPFLNGTGPYKSPHEGWRPSFDYLMKNEVVTKVFETAIDREERCQ
ncbi:hypothetical protein [Xylella fastidiosa]|uniref:hypothetical protein n=1 Tax=Xylella fastidiosa TaxID=2371 RepID=UPI000900371D|nr:hypothetical protein [Xylella fastidiosa]